MNKNKKVILEDYTQDYKVIKLFNSVKYSIGEYIDISEVQYLINCPGWTVEIVAAK